MVLAAGCLALAACTAPDPPTESTEPAGSGEAHGSAVYEEATADGPARNVPAPEKPDGLSQPDEDGARAALEYWWATYRYLELTGDAGYLEDASGSGCSSCGATQRYWTGLYREDHWSTGSERTAEDITVETSEQGTDALLSFVVAQQDYEVWMPSGHVLNPDTRTVAPHHDWRAKARYTESGQWIVYDIWMLYGEREDGGPADESEADGSSSEESQST